MEACGVSDEPGPVKVKSLPKSTCVKCNDKKAVFLFRATDSTCWDCLQELLVRKFKSAVIKGRKSKRDIEKYLVAYSGGASSSALLHLLWNTSNGVNARKKIRLSVVVAHIDESALGLPADEENRVQAIQFLRQVQAKYGYEVYDIGLEQLYATQLTPTPIHAQSNNNNENTDGESTTGTTSTVNEEAKRKLASLFSQATTTTAKEDLQQRLRGELLQRLGSYLKVDSIFLGTPADRAASLLVVNTCLGRGNAFPSAEFPAYSVPFLQPMRDFLLKEIAAYNYHSDVQSLFTPTFSTKKPPKSSIFALSEKFVSGLQADYPHTVHTLLKSEDKLTAPEHIAFNCAVSSLHFTSCLQ